MSLDNWASVVAIVAALAGHLAITSRKFNALDTKLDTKVDALDAKIGALDTKLDTKVGALDTKVNAIDENLDTKIDRVRDEILGEMREGFGRMDTRLTVIEQRTYDLSLRLPPTPAAKHS